MNWQPIKTAPLDETDILIFHITHGALQAHYSPGFWTDYLEGREYTGPVWVVGDDIYQVEIEETPEGVSHAEVTHWMPLPEPPK
jgi:uncharacterized protein DUF551